MQLGVLGIDKNGTPILKDAEVILLIKDKGWERLKYTKAVAKLRCSYDPKKIMVRTIEVELSQNFYIKTDCLIVIEPDRLLPADSSFQDLFKKLIGEDI